jgi:hypothetical protein
LKLSAGRTAKAAPKLARGAGNRLSFIFMLISYLGDGSTRIEPF